jgi:hypothetical protein
MCTSDFTDIRQRITGLSHAFDVQYGAKRALGSGVTGELSEASAAVQRAERLAERLREGEQ